VCVCVCQGGGGCIQAYEEYLVCLNSVCVGWSLSGCQSDTDLAGRVEGCRVRGDPAAVIVCLLLLCCPWTG